ncbi:MAG: RhuM family protein, partial [Candidatus Riflebacteria bacterium]|nr:RhuM family protein [Candidatus Riflebacteria bacterium]
DSARKTDITTAKNYLNEDEIEGLNRIVSMWLDFAEDQAKRRKQVFLKDWEKKLEDFLRFNDRNVLPNSGSVSKKEADDHARAEYEIFAVARRESLEKAGEEDYIRQLDMLAQQLQKNDAEGKK